MNVRSVEGSDVTDVMVSIPQMHRAVLRCRWHCKRPSWCM